MKAAKVTDAKKRFEDASERLRKAAKTHPGVKVLAGPASQERTGASRPDQSHGEEHPGHRTDEREHSGPERGQWCTKPRGGPTC